MPIATTIRALGLTTAVLAGAAGQAALAQGAGMPAGGTYAFDSDHSHIVFSYDHMGFSTSTGLIRGVQGSIMLDPADPAKSTVEASFPLSAIMTVSPKLDAHMMSDDFFKGLAPDATVTFKSTKVEPDDDDEAKVTGDLTLNGVTKPVVLDVDLRKAGENPMSKQPALGFEAETTIKRSDFNLGAFAPAVSDEVEIDIHVEAVKG